MLLEIEKVKEKIRLLEEADAKSLLLIIYARLDAEINGNGREDFQQVVKDLFDIYSRLPEKRI